MPTDRVALVAKVLHGVPLPSDGDQPSFSWAYEPGIQKYAHDSRHAGALLDAAGWRSGPDGFRRRNGVPLRLLLVGGEGAGSFDGVEVFVQQEWRELGVDATIKNYTSAQLYGTLAAGGIEQSGKFDAVFERWTTAADPDDSVIFGCWMTPPAGWNVYHLCNAEVDGAERAALTSYNQAARTAAYHRIQELVADEVPMLPISMARRPDLVSVDFHGYRPAHVATPFWNTWEWSI
jgi:peptide/nickel transport system substrate-binding protein